MENWVIGGGKGNMVEPPQHVPINEVLKGEKEEVSRNRIVVVS